MGETADMMIDGTLCHQCGVYLEPGSQAFPVHWEKDTLRPKMNVTKEPIGFPLYCDTCELNNADLTPFEFNRRIKKAFRMLNQAARRFECGKKEAEVTWLNHQFYFTCLIDKAKKEKWWDEPGPNSRIMKIYNYGTSS